MKNESGLHDSRPLPSGRDCLVETSEPKKFVDELRMQWKLLWRDRIDDKAKAEGIADKDYPELFVERGTVIVATKDYKPPDFVEILQKHVPSEAKNVIPPDSRIGGWGKFVRNVISTQKRFTKRLDSLERLRSRARDQHLKKGGRGWLHTSMK